MEVLAGTGEGQWADLDAFLHGIAHGKRLGLFDKRLGEVVKQRLRHQEALGANATLAVVEVARRHGELHGFRKIGDRKSTRLNSSHANISYAVFCLKKKK